MSFTNTFKRNNIKQTLINVPFASLGSSPNTADYSLVAPSASWILPQLMAFLGSEQIKLSRDPETGLFSFTKTLQILGAQIDAEKITLDNHTVTKQDFAGILTYLRAHPRSSILGTVIRQNKPAGMRWNASVPLFVSAMKEFRNIKYSEWDWKDSNKKYFLDQRFIEFSDYFGKPELLEYFDKELLLTIRNNSFEIKANGGSRTPEGTTSIYNLDKSDPKQAEFAKLPSLLKLCLTQVWVFTPYLPITPYSITNILDLDNRAEPLTEDEVIFQEEDSPWKIASGSGSIADRNKKIESDIPWDV